MNGLDKSILIKLVNWAYTELRSRTCNDVDPDEIGLLPAEKTRALEIVNKDTELSDVEELSCDMYLADVAGYLLDQIEDNDE